MQGYALKHSLVLQEQNSGLPRSVLWLSFVLTHVSLWVYTLERHQQSVRKSERYCAGITSESLGDYSQSYGATLDTTIMGILSPYKRLKML